MLIAKMVISAAMENVPILSAHSASVTPIAVRPWLVSKINVSSSTREIIYEKCRDGKFREIEALCNCQSNEICQHGQCYPNDECAYVHCEQGFYCIHGQCSNGKIIPYIVSAISKKSCFYVIIISVTCEGIRQSNSAVQDHHI